MSYELSIEERPGYLHAVVTGVNSKENVVRYLDDIRRECAARSCSRVLIEENLKGPRLDILDVFDIASSARERATTPLPVVAYVDVNATSDLMKFAEDVAVNRGIDVRVFSSVADAAQWLLDLGKSATEPGAES
jgi:hypothetical protein